MKEKLRNEYFEWLCHFVGFYRHRRLLRYLDSVSFRYTIPMDGNRFEDGVNLRYRFADEKGYHYRYISAWVDDHDCSVLEMMVALCLRIEETIIADMELGDQTSRWFKEMLESMGLYEMDDTNYREDIVSLAVNDMLDRNYTRNGGGGLFYLRHCKKDVRKEEIWHQAMWYIDEIMEENV